MEMDRIGEMLKRERNNSNWEDWWINFSYKK